ncbi:MAG: aminoglycoside phosphotransferase family protein [Firmicutes bacterium]|nr:aminoglycoside phosphotransferase family protein [Bacillota bacterium]MCM1402063.1 aminoglycoside phosphotransferase family protein [Bacteroides sp.]MCM1477994.1 aminoglycoside phosphotransferase family protein [Bacteroides sp.]
MEKLKEIAGSFNITGTIDSVKPLGNGLINDTFLAVNAQPGAPDYVLQRINHNIFTNVDALQSNISAVTSHLRSRLEAANTPDIDRHVLTFIPLRHDPRKTWLRTPQGEYWRLSLFIPDALTFDTVNPHYSRKAGESFGNFQAQLVDLPQTLVETIPNFHNMEYRLQQLNEAIEADPVGRLARVRPLVDDLLRRAHTMTAAERLHRQGKLPKRVCHCDTKVNNMMFDRDGNVLCVIDLDTVMPSFVFSDYGDFLRSAANTVAEDSPELDKVDFRTDIFEAFTEGYLSTAASFLTPLEIEMLPYAAALFPYMQAVRFLTDYINGDTYYKTAYPDHNLVRTRNQVRLLEAVESRREAMQSFIQSKIAAKNTRK